MSFFANQSFRKINICILCLLLTCLILGGSLFALVPSAEQSAVEATVSKLLSSQSLPEKFSTATETDANMDWFALGYASVRPAEGASKYASLLRSTVNESDAVHTKSVTDNCRMGLVLSALDPVNSSTYIRSVLDNCASRGNLYSYIYGLLLADSRHYEFSLRDETVSHLVDTQLPDGGWSMTGKAPSDTDTTAAVLTALAPYASEQAVQTSINTALSWLKTKRLDSGDFPNFFGQATSESTSQILIALCALHKDPVTYFDDGKPDLISVLEGYKQTSGAFSHTKGAGANTIATYQALHGLAAYIRFTTTGQSFFDFTTKAPQETECDTDTETETKSDPESETISGSESATETVHGVESESATSHAESETIHEIDSDQHTETTQPADETTDASETPSQNEDTRTETVPVSQNESSESFSSTDDHAPSKNKPGQGVPFKWILVGIIGLLGGLAVVVLVVTHHASPKRLIPILIITIGAILAVIFFLNIESVNQHFGEDQTESSESDTSSASVTIEIRCYNALPYRDKLLIDLPEDGIILSKTTVNITEGTSVWDVLDIATRKAGIVTVHRGGRTGAYVEAIAGLYEQACGDLSGWVYVVNGIQPSVGCGSYICEDGDEIYWVYSCTLGTDVNEGGYDWR